VGLNWILLAHDEDHWVAAVNTVIKLLVYKNKEFLDLLSFFFRRFKMSGYVIAEKYDSTHRERHGGGGGGKKIWNF
jgi:hypothetical protein